MTRPNMLRSNTVGALAAALLCIPALCQSAGPQLYDTGPSVDAAYLRFVNATPQALDISAQPKGQTARTVRIEPAQPAGHYMAVNPKSVLKGVATQGKLKVDLAPTVRPGQLVSVVVWASAGGALGATTIGESPTDFNALKASLAFYNVDPGCPAAKLVAAGRGAAATIVEGIAPSGVQRRSINPVRLAVQPMCGSEQVGTPLELGALEAGQRYTVVLTSDAGKRRAFWVKDEITP